MQYESEFAIGDCVRVLGREGKIVAVEFTASSISHQIELGGGKVIYKIPPDWIKTV